MLHIQFKYPGDLFDREFTWYVGAKLPTETFGKACDTVIVTSVRATGLELEYVIAYFQHLPYVEGKRLCAWKGDLARFIFDNLDRRLPPSLLKS